MSLDTPQIQPNRASSRLGSAWVGYRDGVVIPFLVQRALLMSAVYFGAELIGVRRTWHALPRIPFLDMWLRWDSFYYLLIATDGYGGSTIWGNPHPFFPLFPMLTVAFGAIMPKALAALLVANGAALVALCLLYVWAERSFDTKTARRAVQIALVFPTSYFLSAAYSESVYLVAAVGTVFAWSERKPWLAALGVVAACLARPVGGLSMTTPFVLHWLIMDRRLRNVPWFVLGGAVGGVLVLAIYWSSTGDPLAFLHAPQIGSLGRYAGTNRLSYIVRVVADEGWSNNLMRRLLNWSALAVLSASFVHFVRRDRWDLALITVLPAALPLAFQRSFLDAASMGRYALAGFPMFVAIARWVPEGRRGRTLDSALQMAQLVLAINFATARWAE